MHKLLQFMLLQVRPYEILKVILLSQVHERLKQTNITCMQYRVILSKKNAITIFIRYFENDTILGITIYHQTICSSLLQSVHPIILWLLPTCCYHHPLLDRQGHCSPHLMTCVNAVKIFSLRFKLDDPGEDGDNNRCRKAIV